MFFGMLLLSYGFGAVGDFFVLPSTVTFLLYCIINPIVGFFFTKLCVFKK